MTAQSVAIVSVVSDKGYWVGQDAAHEAFVELLAPAPPFTVGQRVSFSGTIDMNHPDTAQSVGMTSPADLTLFQQEGFHFDVAPADLHLG